MNRIVTFALVVSFCLRPAVLAENERQPSPAGLAVSAAREAVTLADVPKVKLVRTWKNPVSIAGMSLAGFGVASLAWGGIALNVGAANALGGGLTLMMGAGSLIWGLSLLAGGWWFMKQKRPVTGSSTPPARPDSSGIAGAVERLGSKAD